MQQQPQLCIYYAVLQCAIQLYYAIFYYFLHFNLLNWNH